jgi:hypothetical protein
VEIGDASCNAGAYPVDPERAAAHLVRPEILDLGGS